MGRRMAPGEVSAGGVISRAVSANYTVWGPLAQSVERRADNAKVVSSRLTWTTVFTFFFLNFNHTPPPDLPRKLFSVPSFQ